MKLTIASGDEHDFFRRGQELDSELDRGEPIPEEQLLTFEDRADILELVTTARLALFLAVKHEPGSITDLARRLHRDRSAVKATSIFCPQPVWSPSNRTPCPATAA